MQPEVASWATAWWIADVGSRHFTDASSPHLSRCEPFIRLSRLWRSARDLPSARCQCVIAPGRGGNQNTGFDNFSGNRFSTWQESGGLHDADVRWPLNRSQEPGAMIQEQRARKFETNSRWFWSRLFFRPESSWLLAPGSWLLATGYWLAFLFLDLFFRSGHHVGIRIVVHESGVPSPGDHGLENFLGVFIRQRD
jgi:hypothetical protein